jgi:hypothetical protein
LFFLRPGNASNWTSSARRRSVASAGRISFSLLVSDRLNELNRQRALLQEQLAWLDREIATEKMRSSLAEPQRSLHQEPAPPVASPPVSAATTDADSILAQYRSDPTSLKNDVRKGCLLYFAIASALVGLIVILLYFNYRSRQPDGDKSPPAATSPAP